MANEAEVMTCLDWLAAGWWREQMPPESVRAYVQDLADLDSQDLWEAVQHLRKTAKKWPLISEIREATDAQSVIRAERARNLAWRMEIGRAHV
jgi:hypothetical protein